MPNLINRFIEGETPNNIMYVDAGLPNITGSFYIDSYRNPSVKGAFTQSNNYSAPNHGNWANEGWEINLDASSSSSIYGNSTTVQPKALRTPYIIKY